MGSFTLAVESTARDVNALLTLHRVHPQVRTDVQRLLQHLVKKSYEHMESLQPGFEESPDQICRAIATELVKNVVNIAIPVSQLSREEEQSARYYQELQEVRQQRDALAEEQVEVERALTDLKAAHDYMLHSYFHEVLILRQRISDLQLQQKKGAAIGTSGLSTTTTVTTAASGVHRVSYPSMYSGASRLSTSTAADDHLRRARDERAAIAAPGSFPHTPATATLPPPLPAFTEAEPVSSSAACRLGDVLRGVPAPLSSSHSAPQHDTAPTRVPSEVVSRTHGGTHGEDDDDDDDPARRGSLADLSSPPAFLQTVRFDGGHSSGTGDKLFQVAPSNADDRATHASSPSARPVHSQHGQPKAAATPVTTPAHHPAGASPVEKEQTQMLYAISHPDESVDAVFDYERYVSLLHSSRGPGAWDERYIELLAAKEQAEELVTKERSKRRVGFQFAKAERRDHLERMQHEVDMEHSRNNKWWWAQKLAIEEVQRDYAERIAVIRDEMETLRSTMLHDYMFNLQHAMSLLQSRIDVLLNFFLVYVRATDETVRTIQRDARAQTRADLLIADHHSQQSSTVVKSFFDNPENERERPNIASELIRLQDQFWDADAKHTKETESKEVHPLYLMNDTTLGTAAVSSSTSAQPGKSRKGKDATNAFRTKAQKDAQNGPATAVPGELGPNHGALGEPVRSTVSSPPPSAADHGSPARRDTEQFDASGSDDEAHVNSASPSPSMYKTDGLPYWERHPITESAQKVFGDLQGLARKLRLRKAVQLENEIRITSTRGPKKNPQWRERLHSGSHRPRHSSAVTVGGLGAVNGAGGGAGGGHRRTKSKSGAAGGVAGEDTDEDDDDEDGVSQALTESAVWVMKDGWEDALVPGDAQGRTARELLRDLLRLRYHRAVNTVRRRTTLQKLQGLLDTVDGVDMEPAYARRGRATSTATSAGRRSVTSARGRQSTTSFAPRRGGGGGGKRTRPTANLLSIDHLREDNASGQDLDSDEELDVRIAMLAKVCEVAEDRIQSDTLEINALLRLLRGHKVEYRDWAKEHKETDEERDARLAQEKIDHEAHLARLLASPYWKQPPQRFYPQNAGTVAFLPAGLLQARQQPMASHVVFQGQKIPINAFLQQSSHGHHTGSGGDSTDQAEASSMPSLASRVVTTRGQKRTPYAAVMDYCQGVQMGLPMSDRRGPVYLQYDASTDAFYVADDEGTDLVADGERRLTQMMNSAAGGGDDSANNIFNDPYVTSADAGRVATGAAEARRAGRTIERWTVPMTQVLFPSPARGPPAEASASPISIPGTRQEGPYMYIANPEDGAALFPSAAMPVGSAQASLAPVYLIPMTIPVEDAEKAFDGRGHTRTSALYTTAAPANMSDSTMWTSLPPPLASQLQSIWRPSAPTTGGVSARADNAYYHNPPMVFRPPTEEQRMLAIAGYQLAIPNPEAAREPSLVAPSESAATIHYDGEQQNYTTLFPAGSTFYSTSAPSAAATAAANAVPTTSIIQDPLRAAATSIAKARQAREERVEATRQATEAAQRQRQQDWCDRTRVPAPTERETFLRLRLPHLAPLEPGSHARVSEAARAALASGPLSTTTTTNAARPVSLAATTGSAPSLRATAAVSSAAPSPVDTVKLQQQLRARHGGKLGRTREETEEAGRAKGLASARDVVDKRGLATSAAPGGLVPNNTNAGRATTVPTMPAAAASRTTTGMPIPGAPVATTTTTTTTTAAIAGQDVPVLAESSQPLRLPPEFVQVTQPRTAIDSAGRAASHGAGRQSRKLDGARFQ